MLVLLSLILVALALALYAIAYALRAGKAEDLVMWGIRREAITDIEGYKHHQGRFAILIGTVFLLVPVSLYVVERTSLPDESLYVWIFVLGVVVITNAVQVRAYFR